MKASLRKQAALITCANALTRGMGFCLHLLLARLMSAEALGVMEMAGSVSMLALTPVTAGIPTAMSRMTAQRPGVDRENVLRAGLHHVRRLSLVLSPVLVVLSPLLAWLLGDQRTLPAIAVNAPAMALLGACGVYSGYCIGLGQARLPAACECAEQAVRLGLSVGLVAMAGRVGSGDIAVTAALPGLSEVIAGAVVVGLFRRSLPLPRRRDRPSVALRRQLTRLSLPMMLSRLCATGTKALEAVLLPLCLRRSGLSQAAATAQFGLLSGMALPLMLLPGIVTGALCTVTTPAVTRLEHRKAPLRRMMRQLYLSAALIGLGATGAVGALAGFLGAVVYRQAALVPLLRVMCPLALLLSVHQVQFGMVAGLGLQQRALPGTILSSAVTLMMMAWLCPLPHLRIYGAALALMAGRATGLVWNGVLLARAVRREAPCDQLSC